MTKIPSWSFNPIKIPLQPLKSHQNAMKSIKSRWFIHLSFFQYCFCASLDEIQDWPCPSHWIQDWLWHHSNVEILFFCVPTTPAIGATEMRTVVFDCFSDVSEFRTAQTECINISTYEHTSHQLRMAGSKKCNFSETHFRVLRRWKVLVYQMPSSSHGRSGLLRWLNLGQHFCHQYIIYHISYIIFLYIYRSIFPIFPWGFLELSKWSECAWFRRHSETSLPEPSSSATVVTELPALPSPIFLEEVSVS